MIEDNYGLDCGAVNDFLYGNSDTMPNVRDMVVQLDIKSPGQLDFVMHRPLFNCLKADEDYLIGEMKKSYFHRPSATPGDLNLIDTRWAEFEPNHQAKDINDMVFKNRLTNGFFLEAGAMDCENSVTLPFERQLNWTGLLVEAVPAFFKQCKEKNRRATLMHSCVGTDARPKFIDIDTLSAGSADAFKPGVDEKKTFKVMAGIAAPSENRRSKGQVVRMQCFPVYSMLLAMDNPTVNLFVLDIEGWELAVLRTIPWDKVDIEVVEVETDLAGQIMPGSSRQAIIDLMTEAGYARFDHHSYDYNPKTGMNQNDLFVRRDIVDKYNVVQL